MITMPMIVNSAPTSRTVTAPQPKGRAGGFLRAATAAYARGILMGMDSFRCRRPSDPGDEPRPLQAVRLLRPLARVSPLPRIRGRACVPGAVPSDPRDLVRRGRSRDSDLRGHDAVLPEPCLPGCRVAAVGTEPRVRAGFRPRIGLVHCVTKSSRGFDRETRNTPPRYAALGGGRWRLQPRGKPSRNSLARSR